MEVKQSVAHFNERGDKSGRDRHMSSPGRHWPDWLPHPLWIRRVCPRCESVRFKPAEARAFDGLLAMFALRPVRCMFCWRRYYWITLHAADA
jgi:hypothetical protein